MKTKLLGLLVLSIFMQGCLFRNYPARYGTDFNNMRVQLGIIPLDSTWEVDHTESYYTRWINPDVDKIKAQYVMKQVCYFKDILSMEIDIYENPNSGDLVNDRLAIMFYYRSSRYDEKNIFHRNKDNVIGWDYRYTCDDGHEGVKTLFVSKQQADSIMEAWGIDQNKNRL